MNIITIIEKKRYGQVLSADEIQYFIDGYCNNEIADYQASSLLMAICIQGMNKEETLALTKAMLYSGEIVDLSEIEGYKVDKHSTGGVGDKTTLVLGPMLAACGLKVAKMSGRGLGHTGGTLDKLESIKGFSIELSSEDFIKQVNNIHLAVIGQSDSLVLADKKLYALRDVSGTVASIPLIASSIMSKKLAAGCQYILLDVKYGDGAFMKNKEEALALAKTMIEIGEGFNVKVKCEITNMNEPLGNAIGNALEVKEAIDTLKGNGPQDLKDLCIHSCVQFLLMCKIVNEEKEAYKLALKVIEDGSAYKYLLEMVKAQGGCVENDNIILEDHVLSIIPVYSSKSGYINAIQCKQLGLISCDLGAGRRVKSDSIDPGAGIILKKKLGDYVNVNDEIALIYTNKTNTDEFVRQINGCFEIEDYKKEKENLIYKTI